MVDTGRRSFRSLRLAVAAVLGTLIVGSASFLVLSGGGNHPAQASALPSIAALQKFMPAPAVHIGTATSIGTASSAGAAAPSTAPSPANSPAPLAGLAPTGTAAPTTAAPVTAAPTTVPTPTIAALVAQVEASGLEPGSNWTWSIGDPTAHCGPLSGTGTGCTYGEAGQEYTIFAGVPTLALVAHELANAETQNDAVPNLLNEVAGAAAGTSWSPTDAVASCLVAHFMGLQDDAAGSWQCPAPLAAEVADHIHDTY
jgi:hypothetical protein